MKYKAYTDGSYQESVGAGGCASVILDESNKVIKLICNGYENNEAEMKFATGAIKNTTNNRMEIRGVIQVLKYFEEPVDIEIVSDSQYVISSITGGYAKKWLEEKDFSKKNLDLWFELIDLVEFHNVTFTWVKGHNGDKWNELADTLAVVSARCLNISEEWTQQSS